jgi:regulator of telomere elongation helicase 1
MKLAQITPANRSTLSVSTSQLFSKDQLLQGNLVDLTADTSILGHMKEHTFKALRLKKAKIMDKSKDAVCFDDGSTKQPQNVELRTVARNPGEESTPHAKKSTTEQACEKNDTARASSESQEAYSGPAFLKLVCCSFASI